MSRSKSLLKQIELNNEVIGIIGLGYVGLPLAVSFVQAYVIKVVEFDNAG